MAELTVYVINNTDDGFRTLDNMEWPPAKIFDNSLDHVNVGRNLLKVGGEVFANDVEDLFLRFTNITIPQGSIINSAVLNVVAALSNSNTIVKTAFYGSNEDNSTAPTSWDDYEAKPKTTAYVLWTIPAWTTGVAYSSPDLKTVIKEVVDRVGWVSGNALTLYLVDSGSTALANRKRNAASLENTSYQEAYIVIDYTPPTPPAVSKMMGDGLTCMIG